MAFINMKKRFVSPLPQLAVLALRYVYDKKGMKSSAIGLMEQSIVHWSNKIDITEEELKRLQMIAKVLNDNEKGLLEERKDLFRKHNINWAKFHRMPGMKEIGDMK